ncbi:hypothetical protein ATKI12_8395 [Kitasatospora sp. Ki12]
MIRSYRCPGLITGEAGAGEPELEPDRGNGGTGRTSCLAVK